MLEKIGLPPKPSLRGNNWVADASHCQGCSSQFTFINRKHHCRRCGGLFCNSCTQQRMVLRGQGDSPVRICEPCKKLEEAARFEMRQGRRAGRGSLKSTPRYEDEVLNQILGHDKQQSFSSGKQSTSDTVPSNQRPVGSASSSSTEGVISRDDRDIQSKVSSGKLDNLGIDVGSTSPSPDELRQQALEEKKKYKILKGDGKSEEALRAFKRGKELGRQADALEIHLRRTRKKNLPSGNLSDAQNKDIPIESGRKTKSLPHMGKEKNDLTAELRELGWADMDLHDEDKKPANLSLEGELSSIVGEISLKSGEVKGLKSDKTQVVALKKKALMLKREGKLAEAKEELKRAKLLEKKLEEQELLAEAEDSDDELSALIRGMDNDKEELSNLHDHEHGFDFDNLLGISDYLDGNFEVTDEDMVDPEISAALESLGWMEDSSQFDNVLSESQPFDRETLLGEIQSLKKEALNQKRVGKTAEAMAFLKKAKLLEKDLNSSGSLENNTMMQKPTTARKGVSSEIADNGSDSIQLDKRNSNAMNHDSSIMGPKSRLMIQRELLSLKKKALALRREGKLTEAEEEMRKGEALEHQLTEMDKASNVKASGMNIGGNVPHSAHKHPDIHGDLTLGEGGEDDVTDQDMSDPAYLSLLRDFGWKDDNKEVSNSSIKPYRKEGDHSVPKHEASPSHHSTNILVGAPRRSKFEIQRELLGLKRKALALRREGKVEDAEEVLKMAKELEANMTEVEASKKEVQVEPTRMKDKFSSPPVESADEEGSDEVVAEEDMHDPALHSMLINLGWKGNELDPATIEEKPVKEAGSYTDPVAPSVFDSYPDIPAAASRSKGEIQRELLVLKRKALALRRKGEMEEAEETLRMAKSLEGQLEAFGTQNKENMLNASKDEKSVVSGSFEFLEKHGSSGIAMEVDKGSASSVVGPSKDVAESSTGLERMNDNLIPAPSQLFDDKHSLSVEDCVSDENPAKKMKAVEGIGYNTSAGHTMNTLDLLTGGSWNSSEISTQKEEEEGLKFGSTNLSRAGSGQLDSLTILNQNQGGKNDVATQTTKKRGGLTDANEKASVNELNAVHDYGSQHHQEILAHKRKAVALKREGKLAEAREELRRAKLLEKSLEDGNLQLNTASTNISSDASLAVVQKKQDSSNIASKPLSSRDRFKLQQESLGHKRQALKLRREGRMEEAEVEFERAKALETQLEELAAHDSSKSSASMSDAGDDVTVEDFLDPHLLSALKAVGLEDVSVASGVSERQEPVKPTVATIENSNQERIQLEERIKAEKMKAVNLKRSGKQAEALDALRRAKLYENKLNSITSGWGSKLSNF